PVGLPASLSQPAGPRVVADRIRDRVCPDAQDAPPGRCRHGRGAGLVRTRLDGRPAREGGARGLRVPVLQPVAAAAPGGDRASPPEALAPDRLRDDELRRQRLFKTAAPLRPPARTPPRVGGASARAPDAVGTSPPQ